MYNKYTKISIFANRFNFLVDSQFRTSGTTSNFTFTIPLPTYNDFDSILVSSAIIPKSYYLIRAGYNTFTVVEEGINITITLGIGNYSLTDFIQNISNSLSTYSSYGAGAYTVTYDKALGKFNFTCGFNTLQPKFIFANNVYETLGFNKNSTNVFISGSITSPNVINLNPQEMIYICSDMVNNSVGQVLETIPMSNICDWSFQYYQATGIHTTKELTNNRNTTFNFMITDSSFRELELNGKNVVFNICCHKDSVKETNAIIKENILINNQEKLLNNATTFGSGLESSNFEIGFI